MPWGGDSDICGELVSVSTSSIPAGPAVQRESSAPAVVPGRRASLQVTPHSGQPDPQAGALWCGCRTWLAVGLLVPFLTLSSTLDSHTLI